MSLRILMVEDSAIDAKLVLHALRDLGRELTTLRVEDEVGLRRALAERWDLILSDWSLPTFSGLEALAIVRALRGDLPFIIVSGTVGEALAVAAMREGADDYVLKDDLARLAPAIERELREAAERAGRREAESQARQAEARYRRIVENTAEGVCTLDQDGRVTYANPRLVAMIGAEATGQAFVDLIDETTRAEVRACLGRSRARAERPIDASVTGPEGDRRQLALQLTAIHDEDARFEGWLVMARDVTTLREAEAAQQRAEDALAKSNEQLRHAQKMEAVGRLAGGVAHDFNNLLSVILSYSSMLLEETEPDSPLRGDLVEIKSAGKRAAELTHQLLAFSRQQVIEPRVVELNALVESMERMCRRILGEDIELVSQLDPALSRVVIDPTAFEQVLMNLVVNSRDAMPRGGRLTIETSNVMIDDEFVRGHFGTRPGPHVRLRVSDTGCGMDPETMLHIFEPFFTTKETGKGTGLGLSTVFGIVRQAGGTIWVYSEPGLGTTFKVLLPAVSDATTAPRAPGLIAGLAGNETVLLVEDDDAVRTVVRGILRRNGYRVLEARDPLGALGLAETSSDSIDLLLTDIVMPQMSGPELAKRVRALRPNIRILCMSGYTDETVVQSGLMESDFAFLQKPILPDALLRKVRATLSRPRL